MIYSKLKICRQAPTLAIQNRFIQKCCFSIFLVNMIHFTNVRQKLNKSHISSSLFELNQNGFQNYYQSFEKLVTFLEQSRHCNYNFS